MNLLQSRVVRFDNRDAGKEARSRGGDPRGEEDDRYLEERGGCSYQKEQDHQPWRQGSQVRQLPYSVFLIVWVISFY